MPNDDGSLAEETRILTSNTNVDVVVRKGNKSKISFDKEKNKLIVKELEPGEELDVVFVMAVPEGLNSWYDDLKELYEDFEELFGNPNLDITKIFSWLEYEFDIASSSIGNDEFGSQTNVIDRYTGVTGVSSQKVTSSPKVYISYELNKVTGGTDEYILRITATNVGEGPAYGISVSPPNIPSKEGVVQIRSGWSQKGGVMKGTTLELGDLQPNETTYGDFTIYVPGISDWAKLPGLAVKTQKLGDVVVAPLTLQRYDRNTFMEVLDKIDAEIDIMGTNIEKAINKLTNDLSNSVIDVNEYQKNVIAAEHNLRYR